MDNVENYLHDQVCAGRMNLFEAQRAIATDWLQPPTDALWSDRRLRLLDRRREEGVVERVVEPYGLVSKRGTWHLLAAAGATRRVYRVSRIENAEVLPERFERPPDFDLEAAWAESVSSYPRPRCAPRMRAGQAASPSPLRSCLR